MKKNPLEEMKKWLYPIWYKDLVLKTSIELICENWVKPSIYEKLKYDKDFVLYALDTDKQNIIAKSFQGLYDHDLQIIEKAIQVNKESLRYFSEEVRNNKDIVLKSVISYAESYKYCGYELKKDKQFGLDLLNKGLDLSEYLDEDLLNDKDIAKATINNTDLVRIQPFSEDIKNNKEIMLLAIKKNGGAIKFLSENLKNDKEIIWEFLIQDITHLEWCIGKELKEEIDYHDPKDYLEKYFLNEKLSKDLSSSITKKRAKI